MSENPAHEKITDQDILKVFDNTDDPFLTAGEIADQLPVSRQAVNYRLDRMHEEGVVDRKKTGARAVGWWAKVAPRLSDESTERVERAREEIDRGDTVALEEL
jgi:predicted ArsR family transcriptional regulator